MYFYYNTHQRLEYELICHIAINNFNKVWDWDWDFVMKTQLWNFFFSQHDGRERKQGWFLDEIQVTNPQKSKSWTFPCYQWLSLYESDCQVKRCLKPLVHKKAEKVGMLAVTLYM